VDRQAIFDRVVGHMLVQNEKSLAMIEDRLLCRYRGPRNLRCGIGAIIPDNIFESTMEFSRIAVLLHTPDANTRLREHFEIENSEDIAFLTVLQSIHDSVAVENWMNQFEVFAKTYNLRWTWDADAVIEERSRVCGSSIDIREGQDAPAGAKL